MSETVSYTRRSMVYTLLGVFFLGLLAGLALLAAIRRHRGFWFFPDRSPSSEKSGANTDFTAGSVVKDIPLDKIIANPFQPRRFIDERRLEELEASIEEYGVITPVQVTETDDGQYQLIAGERRVRACERLGESTVPAVIRNIDGEELIEVGFLENLLHEPMHPVEKADMYRRLREEFEYLSIEELAESIGKSPEAIRAYDWIHELVPVAKQAYARGLLDDESARLVRKGNQAVQKKLIDYVAEKDPDTEQLRKKLNEYESEAADSEKDRTEHTVDSSRDYAGLNPSEMQAQSANATARESNVPVMNLDDDDNRVNPPP